ncbi:hypothetical protein [Paraburkholderia lycopersici]|uniref:hypothetical protein n=1 Tax=Paraburkholderia lycopersici TaxID=416944 RepID=UPI000B876CBC|nr:hypothetical protein [Paraburkholderia lycopersici]
MKFLCRFLLACLFALFAVRSATACEHMQRSALPPQAVAAASAHCETANAGDATQTGRHGSHGACSATCCVAGCGAHCGALPVAISFDARTTGRTVLAILPAALRAGITHAPPLPPPIA